MVDLLPEQIQRWQKVESIAREQFSFAGLEEIRTPLLEVTELFSRSIGEATDVVGKEMYTFLDRGERSCTLRPEGTASVVRAALQHGLLNHGHNRLWYSGPMFRYERPQAGRQRQFHQIGVEFLGLASPTIDAELISIGWDFLQSLGLKGLELQINSLGTIEDRKSYRNQLVQWLEVRFEDLDPDSKRRIQSNPLRILDSKNPSTKQLLKDAPTLNNVLSDESGERFLAVQQALLKLGIPFRVNPHLVRGLDYYDHTAFEIISDQLGAQATVCGGGRYDGLVEELGGPKTPAIGWAIGMERLLLLLSDLMPITSAPSVYLVNRGKNVEIHALVLARKLRAAKVGVEIDNSGAAFSKQFKRADRCGASWAIVLGEDEVARGEVRLKRLKSCKTENTKQEFTTSSSDLDGLLALINT